jgi:hypothetical protein
LFGTIFGATFGTFRTFFCKFMSGGRFFLRRISIVELVSLLLLLLILLKAGHCSSDGKLLADSVSLLLGFLEPVGRVDLVICISL